MQIEGSVALMTGGNRGLGKAFVQALLAAGARTIYMGMRQPIETSDPRLQQIRLDITNLSEVATAAEICQDINILINNAGVASIGSFLTMPSVNTVRAEIETNYLGTLAMCRTFAPILKHNGGGALVNMLSVASWFTNPLMGSYSAFKAAEWSLTNGVRTELRSQGTLVIGVHAGFIIVFRVIQGIGAAVMTPGTLAIIIRAFPPQEHGLAIGLNGGISGLGLIAGPVLGGLLVQGASWHWIFFVNIPLGILALILTVLFVPEEREARENIPGGLVWPVASFQWPALPPLRLYAGRR